jgi:hypothetical protein
MENQLVNLENQQYIFKPIGADPTIKNIMRNYFYQMAIVMIIVTVLFFVGPSRWHIVIIVFFICLAILFYYTTITNTYITEIKIDKADNKFYLNYITGRGETAVTVIDLTKSKVNYEFHSSKGSGYWKLSLYDDVSSVELQQGYQAFEKYGLNNFSKQQLDQIHNIVS